MMNRFRVGVAISIVVASVAGAQLDPERNHLACYPVKGKTIHPTVSITNTVGTEQITSLKPVQVCVPTAKTAVPAGTDPITVGVPYFTCYKFKVKGKHPKQSVSLTDQFGTATLSLARPNLLCAPAVRPGEATTTTTTSTLTSTTLAPTTSTTTAPVTSSTAPASSTSTIAPSTTTSAVAATSTTTTTIADTSTTTATVADTTTTTATVPDTTTTTATVPDTTTTTETVPDTTTTTDTTPTTAPDTSTTTTDTTTTVPDTTTTTLPSCTLAEGDPLLACTGVCPEGFACLFADQGCSCTAVENGCGNQAAPQCSQGLCPGGLQACSLGIDGCVCIDIG